MRTLATLLFLTLALTGAARAQDPVWLQIEAHPSLREAEERARAYAGMFPDVGAYDIGRGWYAIAIGPLADRDAARAELARMRTEGLIPRDSFLTDGSDYRGRVWPAGAGTAAPATDAPPAAGIATAAPVPDETPAEARRSERELDRAAREEIQTALQWEGFYGGRIDAAFGAGTRRAMADWQTARGHPATGILTTGQRRELVAAYRAQVARLGMTTIDEAEAGIRIEMPMGLVGFDRHEPPFVHYGPRGESGVRALLISQPGGPETLQALYEVMQTLEIVPLDGERSRSPQAFTITGQDERLRSYTHARLVDGAVKGFSLVWGPGEDALMTRAAMRMRESLESVPGVALDDALGEAGAEQRAGMLAGLEIRRPVATHSGFFVDDRGTVLSTVTGLEGCRRMTIGPDLEVTLAASDPDLGLAVLRPARRLAPLDHARFRTGAPQLHSDVAVAGFSYGGVLELPVLTHGRVADLRGLGGEENVARLDIETLPGDIGGPVFDATGAVLGVLLAPAGGARRLPESVRYAADVAAIAEFLAAAGVEMTAAEAGAALAPDLLSRRAADMTVPVSCWD